MTYAELVEEVMENIGLHPRAGEIQRGEVKRLLNLSMREISLEVGVPEVYVTIPTSGTVTGAFSLPTTIHPEGVIYAEVVEVTDADTNAAEALKNHEIALLTVAEANTFHPTWENDDDRPYYGIPFLLWNPAERGRGIQPVGITTAQYRFLLKAVPVAMSEDSHEPFAVTECDDEGTETRGSGAMPAFHRILAHHVTYELLHRLESDRWQAFFARYEKMKQDMFASIQPARSYLPSVRTSRRVRRHA